MGVSALQPAALWCIAGATARSEPGRIGLPRPASFRGRHAL